MSFAKDNLAKGERIIYKTSLHWIVFLESGFILLTGLAIFYLGQSNSKSLGEAVVYIDYLAYIILAYGVIKFMIEFILHSSSEFVVTTSRILIKVGVLKQTSLAMPLSKVESIEVVQSILGQIFGFGTIHITGTGTATSKFDLISHPVTFRRKMQLASNTGPDEEREIELKPSYRRKRR